MADSEGYLAWADVIRELRITISEDEAAAIYRQGGDGTADKAPVAEPFETILNEWQEVLSHRAKACGPHGAYPFEVRAEGLQRRDGQSPAYLFQLLVSLGSTVSHQDGTTASKMFEELSAAAAGQYLGDSEAAVVFGWPRQELRPGFREAVAELVELLCEDVACADREGMSDLKDDGLDVVAWRGFPDRKPSKLILFGQCATGQHWRKKTHELRPRDWCKRNFAGTLALDPVPAFFVPMALSERDANDAGVNQLLLDRCRISALCGGALGDGLDERLWQWIGASLEEGITLDAD